MMLFICVLTFYLISVLESPLVNCQGDETINTFTDAAYPEIFDVAKNAIFTTNATCGQTGAEPYCLYRQDQRETECSVCDATGLQPLKRHPITNVIDGTSTWWQSPTLQSGKRYEWVTITIDLKQTFQIHHVTIQAAQSPLPGNWVLEKSIDGIEYKPWQYFAVSNTDCWRYHQTKPTAQYPPNYRTDDDVVCTAYFAQSKIIYNQKITVNLTDGRPGAGVFSPALLEFTKARFIRLRLQKFAIHHEDGNGYDYAVRVNETTANQLYYTLQSISIGGQCICNGHASKCPLDPITKLRKCECLHNTCGDNCLKCCPLFNQMPYKPASKTVAAICEACECHGHAKQCVYDAKVAARNGSINALGQRTGGGVCVSCGEHTTGNNCDSCVDGYFRPKGVPRNASEPCRPCSCRGVGTTEYCIKDDSHILEGYSAGDCLCKTGFAGKNCESCDRGFKNYPRCEMCYCAIAGVTNTDACEGPCICKKNVEGPRCDKCKAGYYNLDADNPDGCSPCFCFGATTSCKSSDWGIEIVSSTSYLPSWKVTDLNGEKVLQPQLKDDHIRIANDDMNLQKPYYWQAPSEYLGKKLYSYGGDLRFIIGYTVSRGDVSGIFTLDADVIVEGGPNDYRIGYNWKKYSKDADKVLITLPLREQEWFILDRDGKQTRSASREEYTLVLYNLKRMLIRAKFHTDQLEGSLYQIEMEKASNDSQTLKKQEGAEACNCPEGYAGLSCEECAPGYRRVNNILVGGQCVKCDCNNHALSCDPFTGACSECLHNTMGPNCGLCKPGFYGNALIGKEDDCQPCACPLLIESNNFSPTCVATPDGLDYECDACIHPYTGKKCNRCKEGFYGDPNVPGGECLPCECGPNVDTSKPGYCDHRTGQCRCEANVTGWKCDQCAEDFWGDPAVGECKPCNCFLPGSLSSQCDPRTGQCRCKPNYTGRHCQICKIGHGNVELGCPACACDPRGSLSTECDPATGQCLCKPGVFGHHCSKCLDGYYGFSDNGCLACDCHPKGSEDQTCEENNGQCKCHPNVEGRECNRCVSGYWNIDSGTGCERCMCNTKGSMSSACDETTGQCECKPGVGGIKCEQCLPGYYGFGENGCQKCDICLEPNHICNPLTGKCECPPNTAGIDCRDCAPGTYGLDIIEGCKPCQCDVQGSLYEDKCDNKTGQCFCVDGFEGIDCSKCEFGYYNFPNCRRCDCHPPGTERESCRIDLRPDLAFNEIAGRICQCDVSGKCPCRANVRGWRCDHCKDATFSLTDANPLGCFGCFCFEKTNRCDQSKTFWTTIHMPPRKVTFGFSDHPAESILGFNTISDDSQVQIIGSNDITDRPYYWQLPKEFLGDQVASYNGYLTFRTLSQESSRFPDEMLRRHPLIILQGNHRLILHHFGKESTSTMVSPFVGVLHRIHLHESEWTLAENPRQEVTRKVLMIALQKVQHILIRASNGPDVSSSFISDLTLDTSSDVISPTDNYTAIGIEQCKCPPAYKGASCQDPNIGYYRKRIANYLDSKDPIDLVGWAEPCPCNNRSRTCDPETGHCFNCTENTTGPFCNLCASGYFGDPMQNVPCLPCHCPLPGFSFAKTCQNRGPNDYICSECEQGYFGDRCEQCAPGYFGNPLEKIACLKCDCSPYGSLDADCDPTTGQCKCKEGFRGRDCRICLPRHVQTETGCLDCDGPCTGLLLDDLDSINATLEEFPNIDWKNLPYIKFSHILNRYMEMNEELKKKKMLINQGNNLINNLTASFDFEALADILYLKTYEMEGKMAPLIGDILRNGDNAQRLLEFIQDIYDDLLRLLKNLKDLAGEGSNSQDSDTVRLLAKAEQYLSEIKIRNFGPRLNEAERENRLSKALLERILGLLKLPNLDKDWLSRLNRLMKLLSSTVSIVQERVQKPVSISLNKLSEGQQIKASVNSLISESDKMARLAENDLTNARDLINRARNALNDFAMRHGLFPSIERELRNAAIKLKELRDSLTRLNPEYRDKYVEPCKRHADELEKQLNYLRSLFTDTENVSRYAVQAAQVYNKIILALERAEQSAKRAQAAAERAYKEAYPSEDDSLVKRAQLAEQRSYQLLEAARDLRDNKILALQKQLAGVKIIIDQLHKEITALRNDVDTFNRNMDQLPKGTRKLITETEQRISDILENLGNTHSSVDKIIEQIAREINPGVDRLREGTAAGVENLTNIIEKARLQLKDSATLLINSENLRDKVEQVKAMFELDLTDLIHRILLARQKAASIRVSLKADRNEMCFKSYKPQIKPSSSNTITLHYAISDADIRNSLILFVSEPSTQQNASDADFMAIEMINRRIRFIWNCGRGPKYVDHPLEIKTSYDGFKSIESWYKIEVIRVNNVVNLTVSPTLSAHKSLDSKITKTAISDPTAIKMNFNSNTDFYIGSLPDSIVTTRAVLNRRFTGCIHEVFFDSQKIGLWNFATSAGCNGCVEGIIEVYDHNVFFFDAQSSYGFMDQIARYNREKYSIAFDFSTFDENALLFFAGNPDTGDFVSISLQDGRVLYQFSIANITRLQLRTRKQYNIGKWVKVSAERDRYNGVFYVEDEEIEGSIDRGSYQQDLNYAQLYFGGVTANFTQSLWLNVIFRPFLGCMRAIQIDTTSLNLLNGQTHGVFAGCKDRTWRSARFNGKGFLELDARTLKEDDDFSFTVATNQTDALLLLSTFAGQNPFKNNQYRDSHFYSLAIVNGLLEIRVNSGSGSILLVSELQINDGQFHTIAITKRKRKVSILLDDRENTFSRLSKGSYVIEAPEKGGLYLGGLPDFITLRGMANTKMGLIGVIKDFVFSGKIVKMNEPVNFKGVDIGRS